MKRWLSVLGAGLAVAGLVFVGRGVVQHGLALAALTARPGLFAWLALAMAVYLATLPLAAAAWQTLLAGLLGARPAFSRLLTIGALAQAGKYAPGNVLHHFGRVALAAASGLPVAATAVSLALEGGMLVVVGLALAGAAYGTEVSRWLPRIELWLLFLAVGLALLRLPRRLAPLLRARLGRQFGTGWRWPSAHRFGLCALLDATSFLLFGLVLALVEQGLLGRVTSPPATLVGGLALVWVAGFLAPGAPAGLGIREALLVAVLRPELAPSAALAVALALRGVTTAADAVAFVAGLLAHKRPARLPVG